MFFLGFTSSLPGWAYTIRLTGLKPGWLLAWAVFLFGYVIEIIAWFVTGVGNEVEQWLEANVACRLLEGIGGAGMLVGVLVVAPGRCFFFFSLLCRLEKVLKHCVEGERMFHPRKPCVQHSTLENRARS